MNKNKPKLLIDWCSFDAAKFACINWHYSKCMPAGKLVKIGVWENNIFIGCVIYGLGANNNAYKYFNLKNTECCELVRVSLNKHITPVSKILSISKKLLIKKCPGLKLIFSYADKTNQNHNGTIYQADNWLYLGERKTSDKGAYYKINGKKIHGRSARAKYGKESNFPKPWYHWPSQTKHLYVKILDDSYTLNKVILSYPVRIEHESNALSYQDKEGGAIPTNALQFNENDNA